MSKKERNMGNPYPVYPTMPNMMPNGGMMPNMMPPMMPGFGMMPNGGMGMPNEIQMPMVSNGINNIDSQLAMMNNKITNLEKRVSYLEGSSGTDIKYNESNYYIV